MAIERKMDNLGRIVLPKEMRDRVGLEEGIPVSIISNDVEIIIRNAKPIKTKSEIKEHLNSLEVKTEYDEGMRDALKWVLNEKGD